jgi:hypothetical protein
MDEERPDRAAEEPEDEGIPDLGPGLPEKKKTGDPQEGMVVPRDRPRGAEGATTAREQREGLPVDERLDQEEPQAEKEERRQAGRLRDEGDPDTEKDAVADEAEDDVEGLSAEERAVRIEEDAPGGTGGPDHYVEE